MQKTDLEKFCKDWLAAWMSGSAEQLRAFYTQDAFYSDPVRRQGMRGPELLPYLQKLLTKYPGWAWEVVEIMSTPKGFCVKWEADFKLGPRVTGLDIVELEAGLISRNEVYFDRAPLLQA